MKHAQQKCHGPAEFTDTQPPLQDFRAQFKRASLSTRPTKDQSEKVSLTIAGSQLKRTAKFHTTKPRKQLTIVRLFNLLYVRKKKSFWNNVRKKSPYQRLTKISYDGKNFEVHTTQIQNSQLRGEGKKNPTPLISCFNRRKYNFGQTTLLTGFSFWMSESSVSQTYRFMYKQHVTSPAPYVFVKLTDIENISHKHTLSKLIFHSGFFLYFHW